MLDAEKGESLAGCIESVRQYLSSVGFGNPVIIPMMANIALVVRKKIAGARLTRVERVTLRQALHEIGDDFESLEVNKWMYRVLLAFGFFWKKSFRNFIEGRKLRKLEALSGLNAVKYLIEGWR